MKYIANIFSILLLHIIIISTYAHAQETPPEGYSPQPEVINAFLNVEKNAEHRKNIIKIIDVTDNIYKNLHDKLKSGGRITIFFDPAHGKLPDGKWESEISGRLSCTGLPEEYYSIQISRRIYDRLSKNKLIDIKSTDDFLSVLKSESDNYQNIPFSKTIDLAMKNNAFIIISEHLNNVTSLKKANGLVNITGIHITMDEGGNKYLSNINAIYAGFLSLYNKFDITGLSGEIAVNLKENLVDEDFKPNNWEFGTVADDRFPYFYDFPISIIFESGFISNPAEEEILKNPDNQDIIAQSQYEAILGGVNNIFGIDIAGGDADATGSMEEHATMIKLSRIAFYYIQRGEGSRAVYTLNKILQAGKDQTYKYNIQPYRGILNIINEAESYYLAGINNLNAKKWWNSRINFTKAWRRVKNAPLYSAFAEKYSMTLLKHFKIVNELNEPEKVLPAKKPVAAIVRKAPRYVPVIFPLAESQSIAEALKNALQPDPKMEETLLKSFENACELQKKKVYNYSAKKKKMIFYYKWEKKKINFTPGIYIVNIAQNLSITRAVKVSQVPLDPARYQNQQYLNNSFFAFQEKDKSL